MTQDAYTRTAPFYDLWHEDGHVPEIRKLLPPLLDGVTGGVLEIGAGTGLITQVIGDTVAGEIFAVEPSLGMRAILLSRLSDRPALRERVTVLPYGALDADLDEPVEAVVMISVLYGFAPEERPKLWETLARQLRPGGRLIFNWRQRPVGVPGPPEVMGSYRVGRHTYEIAGQVVSATPEKATSRFSYRILQRGVVISEDIVETDGYRPTLDELTTELTAAGFTPTPAPDGLLTWHHP
ncbi:methyltransferase domain-containing protein [Nonomuraea endophytica]|uniref:SAM-dependent methyltransferase n=1 Tax=Nonomuraea endophytica TaxID=714136 RepID=A0A7W8EI26_9ACTN|nr:methyltransferase domain-containing protein [Nonomuraea endophytica]MBB5080214.1 SAM-dependent methyltransferase [Nonomuraea endophytica]